MTNSQRTTHNTQLLTGYKQTEAGVIPLDWKLRPLGDLVAFLDGKRRPVKDTDRAKMRGSIPYYGASGIVDYVNDYLFDEELILLGEDGENILSRSSRLAFRISGKVWVNNHAHVLKPNPDLSIGFLADYLESLNYERFNSGTAQPKLNKQTCFRIPIAFPPTKAEQEAIAEALGDAAALITALEQLIAKKRHIKQGAMQELLTGKRRLNEFSQNWKTKKLGDIFEITAGGDFNPLLSSTIQDEHHPYPIYSNAITDKGLYGFCSYNDHHAGSITVTARGTLGAANYRDHDFTAIGRVIVLKPIQPLDALFISEFINNRVNFVIESTGVPQLTAPQISKYEILFPEPLEQTAIATILSDMDTEITALESKLHKTRHLKQGMMQQLLTGRIRLI